MKMIGFLFLVALIAQTVLAEERFAYSQSMECYVKEYENKVFKNIDDSYFVGKPLRVADLKRTPGFVAFKVNGKLYVAPKKCLSSLGGEEEEFILPNQTNQSLLSKDQEWEEDSYRLKKENIEKRKNQRLQEDGVEPVALKKKYFVELFGGKTFGGSTKPVVNEIGKYITFRGEDDIGNGVETIEATPTSVSESKKVESSFGVGAKFGYKNGENSYYLIQYKSISAKKDEKINYQLTSPSTTLSGPLNYKWKFSGSQLYLGYAYCISCKGKVGFYLNLLGGINSITAKVNVADDLNYTFSTATLGGELGVNTVFVLSDWISLSLNLGYDLQTGGTYKLKGTENNEVATGFKSDMSLGGPFANLGLRVHF